MNSEQCKIVACTITCHITRNMQHFITMQNVFVSLFIWCKCPKDPKDFPLNPEDFPANINPEDYLPPTPATFALPVCPYGCITC